MLSTTGFKRKCSNASVVSEKFAEKSMRRSYRHAGENRNPKALKIPEFRVAR
jgi:hypothetical protein